ARIDLKRADATRGPTGACMLSEEPKLNDSAAEETDSTSCGPQAQPQSQPSQQAQTAPPSPAAAEAGSASQPQRAREPQSAKTAAVRNEEEESRQGGDVDFGKLLDQFEQEQASLQEGEVVSGTVVGISERGVVIDFGYKSEGIVNPAEFTENGVITVNPGD